MSEVKELKKAIEELTEEVRRLRNQPPYLHPMYYPVYVPVNPQPYYNPYNPFPLMPATCGAPTLTYTSTLSNTHG